MARNKSKGGVEWSLPGKKRPFAYSTEAVNYLIIILSQEYTTIQDVYNHYSLRDEGKDILKRFIEEGYGNEIAAKHFGVTRSRPRNKN